MTSLLNICEEVYPEVHLAHKMQCLYYIVYSWSGMGLKAKPYLLMNVNVARARDAYMEDRAALGPAFLSTTFNPSSASGSHGSMLGSQVEGAAAGGDGESEITLEDDDGDLS